MPDFASVPPHWVKTSRSINDLLTDRSGNTEAAVISAGGVLGVGAHLVAVPFDKVRFVNEPVATE